MNKLLGKKIRELRQNSGMTQEAVAQLLFISRQKYARIEKGVNDITLDILTKISAVFSVPVSEITGVLEQAEAIDYRTGDGEKGSLDTVFEMLDLFYANKHIYEKMNNQDKL